MVETSVRMWDQAATAWFDRPDAMDKIAVVSARWRADPALIREWVTEGYFVVERMVPDSMLDGILADVRDIWEADRPRQNLVINRLTIDGTFRPSVPHAEILALPREQREAVRKASNYTLGDIHLASPAVMRAFRDKRILSSCSAILDADAEPRNTLYFDKGSQQGLHQDTAVFHVFPANNLVGVWIALEDIHPDSGPLVYYPGSHREPRWSGFPNYPQTNLRTGPPDIFPRYDAYLAELAKKYSRKQGLLRKGSALFWHGMLIHGGDTVRNPTLTRQSLVIHAMRRGTDVLPQMVGPFNW